MPKTVDSFLRLGQIAARCDGGIQNQGLNVEVPSTINIGRVIADQQTAACCKPQEPKSVLRLATGASLFL